MNAQMRQPFQQPTIHRHDSGLAGKLGSGFSRPTLGEIDGIPTDTLLKEFGSPLFVFSERAIRKRFREAQRAFSLRHPNVQFAWSYKTNYLDAICSIYHQEGAIAEVVSHWEYEMARRLGVPGSDIIFNGPQKPVAALERAVAEGASIHVNGFDELEALESIARRQGRSIPVALRIGLDAGIEPQWTRFGFNLESGEARSAIRRMSSGDALVLDGLHTHLGTFVLSTEAYQRGARSLAELALWAEKEHGFRVDKLDMGGGFASRTTLHSQYTVETPTLDEYAEALTSGLAEVPFPGGRIPQLVLETGRGLIDEAGTLLTSVVGTRRLPCGTRALDVDAGVNLLFTAYWYRLNATPLSDPGGLYEETAIHGPLCMNIDVVRPGAMLPPLEVGDAIALAPVGAYNVTQWMQFIQMRPAVVMIGEGGEVDLIRSAEGIEAVKQYEHLPGRLV
jgi:diaminopimelate decarboxylase